MFSPVRSFNKRPAVRRDAGFTLVELMIGVAIGLFASLAVTHVLVNSEGYKRAATATSDAQVNGALALSTLQRSLLSAGYGLGAAPSVIGCPLKAAFKGAAVAGFPTNLVPVTITNGAADAPDTVRILASGKTSFSVPLRVLTPGYDPLNALTNKKFPVNATAGVFGPRKVSAIQAAAPGDLMVSAKSATADCEVFEVREDPGVTPSVAVVDSFGVRGDWNAAAYPAGQYLDGSLLVDLGQPVDVTYSIQGDGLAAKTLRIATNGTPSYDGPVEAYPGIVNLQALYGKATVSAGVVDTWDNTTPTTNAGWLQVVAVRIAVVARSTQFEKATVTFADPQWDLGASGTVTGSAACTAIPANKCITLKVSHLADWGRYRYRVFETVVPLRNMLWN
jgi:type IV pilus assembly protein PilW